MTQAPPRKHYLDNLKSFLTVLVVAHHAADPYAWTGYWPYKPSQHDPWLFAFLGVNASFFMGLFFFISAYFTPGAVDRKGVGRYLRDRLRRLGIPLLLYTFTVVPLLTYVHYLYVRPYGPIAFGRYYLDYFLGFGVKPADWSGPAWPDFQFLQMWFVEHLLIYALLYALWRTVFRRPAAPGPAAALPVNHVHAAVFNYTVALGLVTALVEIALGGGWIALFGFIQLELFHFPQYATLFVFGLVAYRRGWLDRFPVRAGWFWLGVGLSLAAFCYGNRVLWRIPREAGLPIHIFMGISLCVGFVTLFRERFDFATPFTRFLAANAYSVYICHFPLVVAIQIAIEPLGLAPIPSTVLVALLAIPASFLVSHYGLRRIPYADRVL